MVLGTCIEIELISRTASTRTHVLSHTHTDGRTIKTGERLSIHGTTNRAISLNCNGVSRGGEVEWQLCLAHMNASLSADRWYGVHCEGASARASVIEGTSSSSSSIHGARELGTSGPSHSNIHGSSLVPGRPLTARASTVDLRNNSCSGTIPDLGGLNYTRFLYLSKNSLTGTIPSSLAKLTALEWLYGYPFPPMRYELHHLSCHPLVHTAASLFSLQCVSAACLERTS